MSAISWEEQVNDDLGQMKGSFSKSITYFACEKYIEDLMIMYY